MVGITTEVSECTSWFRRLYSRYDGLSLKCLWKKMIQIWLSLLWPSNSFMLSSIVPVWNLLNSFLHLQISCVALRRSGTPTPGPWATFGAPIGAWCHCYLHLLVQHDRVTGTFTLRVFGMCCHGCFPMTGWCTATIFRCIGIRWCVCPAHIQKLEISLSEECLCCAAKSREHFQGSSCWYDHWANSEPADKDPRWHCGFQLEAWCCRMLVGFSPWPCKHQQVYAAIS